MAGPAKGLPVGHVERHAWVVFKLDDMVGEKQLAGLQAFIAAAVSAENHRGRPAFMFRSPVVPVSVVNLSDRA